jgi:hypothetical protein
MPNWRQISLYKKIPCSKKIENISKYSSGLELDTKMGFDEHGSEIMDF